MLIVRLLTASLLVALFNGVGAKTGITTVNRIDEELLLEDTVFWGRDFRKLKGMSMHLTPKLNLGITCTADKNGEDCTNLQTPEPLCGNGLDTLMFTFIGGNCDQSINVQDEFKCQDTGGGPSEDDDVQIQCKGQDGKDVFDGVVAVGAQITFGQKTDIPDEIECIVMDNEGNTLQTFNVRTTDEDELYLKDIFGSLQLESCDNQECRVDAVYVYTIVNDGNTQLEIVSVDRSRNGATDSVTDLANNVNLRPGESTSANEAGVIDICMHASIVTLLEAAGKSPSGSPVSANDIYVVDVTGLPEPEIPEPCVTGKGGKKGGKKGGSSDDYSGKGQGKKGKKGGSSDDYGGKGQGKGGKKGGSSDDYGGKGQGKGGKSQGKGTMTGGNSENSGKGSSYIRRLGGLYSFEDDSDAHVGCHEGKGTVKGKKGGKKGGKKSSHDGY